MTGLTSTPDAPQGFDLRALLRSVPPPADDDGEQAPRRRVTLLEPDGPRPVNADPLPVTTALDGVQGTYLLTRREHRSIWLVWWAAGAVGVTPSREGGRGLRESLGLVCSYQDEQFCRSLPGGFPCVAVLGEHDPAEIDAKALEIVQSGRAEAEASLARELPLRPDDILVVDGSIAHLQPRPPGCGRVVGLVKTTRAAWLQDEPAEISTEAEHRSAIFRIEGRNRTDSTRFSTYLRMHSVGPTAPWTSGLVRLEAHDPDLLDGLCAWTLRQRQPSNTGDRRWRRHAAAIRLVEETLRARRPAVFDF